MSPHRNARSRRYRSWRNRVHQAATEVQQRYWQDCGTAGWARSKVHSVRRRPSLSGQNPNHIVGQAVEPGVHDNVVAAEEHCMPVRRRFGDGIGRNGAVGAAPILDDDLLIPCGGKARSDKSSHKIRWSSRWEAYKGTDWTVWPERRWLRIGGACRFGCRNGCGNCQQSPSAPHNAVTSHGTASLT